MRVINVVTRVGARERSRGDASDIDGQTERSQWAGAHKSTRAANEFQIVEDLEAALSQFATIVNDLKK